MKLCTGCDEVKPLDQFYRAKTNKDGCTYLCKQCAKEYFKHYYRNNREDRIRRSSDWNRANPDKVAKIKRRYNAKEKP